MAIINVMELFVEQQLETIIPTADFCTCEKCLDDIRAIALNKLPHKYVTTDKGRLFSKLDSVQEPQNGLDIKVAIFKGIDFIKEHPHHDSNPEQDEGSNQEQDKGSNQEQDEDKE